MIQAYTNSEGTHREAFVEGTRRHATKAFKAMLWIRKTKYITIHELDTWAKDCTWTNKEAIHLLNELFTDYFWAGTEVERRTEMNKILKAMRLDLPVKFVGRISKLRMFLMFY